MSDYDTPDLTLQGLIHDLNNVFQTVLDSADLLSEDPKWTAVAGAIIRSAEHGQRLTRSISEASHSTFEFFIIAEIAIQFARDFLHATHGPHIEFTLQSQKGLRIKGSAVAWERVIVNLLLNSAQAMPHGGRVDLSASSDGDRTTIRVADTGCGILAEILPHVFEPHVSTKHASSGLGLHIVRTIVELNGGSVLARNRDEGGAEFLITIASATAT